MCVLAFLAVSEQVQKQTEHIGAIAFHPLPPRWQAEGHRVQHTTALAQGSIAQDHFSMHYTAQNLWYANECFLLLSYRHRPGFETGSTQADNASPAELCCNQQSSAERRQLGLACRTGTETLVKEQRKTVPVLKHD